ncbi:hypothetical protein [Clostridium fungisolvens]|uniref:Uncharacterized protein n=1 Tax=Clostridium fungisolvens TaxID=1604897 RepID=A0A6V8SGD4_9CLOT|nr:hypothetical protein [Clostridium fungisolvens]GFP76100.1 hypothetical protein bsdtw1_02196 [Clostridium fungisolvens]
MRKPRKKYLFFLPIAVILVLIYYFSITVNFDNEKLAKRGVRNLIDKSANMEDVYILQSINLGKEKYTLVEVNNKLFLLQLGDKLFNRRKVTNINSLFGSARAQVFQASVGKYLIYYGRVENPTIKYVIVNTVDKKYRINFSNTRNILEYCKVEDEAQTGNLVATYDYYDKDGKLILNSSF